MIRIYEIREEGSVPQMHDTARYNSEYSRYVKAACDAHLKDLLRVALSGYFKKRLSDEDARDCVQEAFAYLLNGIEKRNPAVLAAISQNPPESRRILYLLIAQLKLFLIDAYRLRKRRNERLFSDIAPVAVAADEDNNKDGGNSYVERTLQQAQPPWHTPPMDPESAIIEDEDSPLNRLNEVFEKAMLADRVNSSDQRVYQLLLREAVGEITGEDAAAELGVSKKRYQNRKSEVKKKLRDFLSENVGGEYV